MTDPKRRVIYIEGDAMHLDGQGVTIPNDPRLTNIKVDGRDQESVARQVHNEIQNAVDRGEPPAIFISAHGLPNGRLSNDGRLTTGHQTGVNVDGEGNLQFTDTIALIRGQVQAYESAHVRAHPGQNPPPMDIQLTGCYSAAVLASLPSDLIGKVNLSVSDSDSLPAMKPHTDNALNAFLDSSPEEGFLRQLLRREDGLNPSLPSAVFHEHGNPDHLRVLDGRALANKIAPENLDEMKQRALANLDKLPEDLRDAAKEQIEKIDASQINRPGWNKYDSVGQHDNLMAVPALIGYLADYDKRYSPSLDQFKDRVRNDGLRMAVNNFLKEEHTDPEIQAFLKVAQHSGWPKISPDGSDRDYAAFDNEIALYCEAGLKQKPPTISAATIKMMLKAGVSGDVDVTAILEAEGLNADKKDEIVRLLTSHGARADETGKAEVNSPTATQNGEARHLEDTLRPEASRSGGAQSSSVATLPINQACIAGLDLSGVDLTCFGSIKMSDTARPEVCSSLSTTSTKSTRTECAIPPR